MRRAVPAVVLFLSVLTLAFVVWGDALNKGESALIQRRYAEAVVHLRQAVSEEPEASRDRPLLLLGRALALSGKHAEAVATYRRLLAEHGNSPLAAKARFAQADALAASGDYSGASQVYRDEIERLTGLSRKEEVAATYLGLAEKALTVQPKDLGRAVTFFDLALDLGLSESRAWAVRLMAAEVRLEQGEYGDAIKRFTPLVEELTVVQGKLPAMLGLGRARRSAGDRAGARTVLRDLITLAVASAEAADAAYEVALSYGVPQPSAAELDRAVAALERLEREYPAHGKARIVRFLIARCARHVGRSEQALAALREFVAARSAAGLDEVAQARAMVGDVLAGQGKLELAIAGWRGYLTAHPAHGEWERVQRAIVDAEYQMAWNAYQSVGEPSGAADYGAARERFDAFAKAYPLDGRNPTILLTLGEMLAAEKKWNEAREGYSRCVSKYPGKEASSQAQYRIGEIFERETFNYVDALAAYKKVTWGSWAARAQQRIGLLSRTHLALLTPRTFRTGEPAYFELTSRNIEKVRVRVFKLDMETYFRATHMAGGVERLDIEVIEPDEVLESAVPEYQKYQETERRVEIGFAEAGAYVVAVDDRELEATTMVLVTDVALIAKSSRHELFVFTQNLKEERPEGGVKVVLSDGVKLVTEGVTGTDGVWRYQGGELKNHDELRVFCVSASGSGAGSVNLSGMGYSPGLTAKGYLFTDRPAYRPGQAVHLKGIVREVRDGLYQLPAAKGYRLQVLTSSGRLMLEREVAFTRFGTFAADLALPVEAELGTWRVRVDRGASSGTEFTGSFTVANYERPRLELSAELKQRVVYRGERIVGTLKLRYFFGEPAVGKDVQYSMPLPDGSVEERSGRTNAAGEVAFSLPTTEFGEEGIAVLTARVVEENVQTRVAVPVVTTEFTPSLQMVRSVSLAGEPFDVTVKIADRSGAALGRQGTARLIRVEQRARGGHTEVEVAQQTFETNGKSGEATLRFVGGKGGQHLVRLEAEDRFGTLVTGQLGLLVSGDDDEVKLRLLSDRQSYKVGETVQVRVANRAGRHLALRTVQGDGILSYEPVVIEAGESTLAVVLDERHAPNFALALALIDGQRLHEAQREFVVGRSLSVMVRSKKAVARPGEAVEFELQVADAAGRPVAAELSLSLVDASLLSVFPEAAPPIGPFFYGGRRETAFRTVSSCSWRYTGASREVSVELLAEEHRRDQLDRGGAREGTDGDSFFNEADEFRAPGSGRVNRPAPGSPSTPGPAQDLVGGRLQFAAKSRRQRVAGDKEDARRAYLRSELSLGDSPGSSLTLLDALASLQPDAPLDEPRRDFSETGAWLSSVVTDAAGMATAKLSLPHSTTEWKILVRGVTVATDVGQGAGTLRTAKDLQAAVVAPRVLTEGDRTELTVRVHNLTADQRSTVVQLVTQSGTQPMARNAQLEVDAHREAEVRFPVQADATTNIAVRMAARSGELEDRVERVIAVRPFGIEFRDGAAGDTTQEASLRLSLPAGREFTALRMAIEIGPDPGRDLISAALGFGYRTANCRRVDATNLARASRGLGVLWVLDYLERAGRGTPADAAQLRGVASACLAGLVSSQRPDGSWSWVGDKAADPRTTSQALLFLGEAKRRGMAAACEAPLNKAAEWLLAQLRNLRGEPRVRAAGALAAVGRSRFEVLNALHRERSRLGAEGLARLALAWQDAERRGLADEVLGRLRTVLQLDGATGSGAGSPEAVEAVALAATALLRAAPGDALSRRVVAWLKARRRGASWGTPEATAAALRSLAMAGGSGHAAASQAAVTVKVNGQPVGVVGPKPQAELVRLEVPAEVLKARDNEVRISVRGRGTVHYAATLTGFAVGVRSEDRADRVVRTRRKYLPALRRHHGKPLQPGFGVVQGRYSSFENDLTELEAGKTGRVRTWFSLRDSYRKTMTPLVVEEPIPAGCSVPRDSIQGGFDHVVVEPGRLTFYYREGRYSDNIRYELHGRFPGKYRTLPTRVYGAQRPDLIAHGPAMALVVKPRGERSGDRYRMTPDELFNLGKALYDAGDLDAAGVQLDQLLAEWHKEQHQLRDRTFKEVARMMLFVSVARGDSKGIVRFFEELKDRYAELVIPFDKVVAVGKAYLDLGEFERALMVFKGTGEASFLKEAAVAQTLQQLGEVKASTEFLRRLLLTYPDLNTIRASLYGIGQQLAGLAAQRQPGQAVDDKVGSTAQLRARALQAFREFLVQYPDDPLAEEVSFAWATTHVEGENLAAAKRVAESALARYPKSTFEDELLYTVGYAQFALGEHEAAFATLTRVAEEEFARPGGGRGASENRDAAVYLQGQIHHARGEPAKALELYGKVLEKFTDAAEASDYFKRKGLSLPEVTTCGVDEDAVLKVSYRNLEAVSVKVYRVDLMRLYLQEKSLNRIRNVELHGIRPHLELSVPLGDGRDYRQKQHELRLALETPGAYLVVARGGDLLATGMVLRTDVVIEAQESLADGRLRVNVKQDGRYLAAAHVKVVGSGDGKFRSGDTDLRGVFTADDLVGQATVLVKKGDRFAFFRGKGVHQLARYRPAPPEVRHRAVPTRKGKSQRFDGWKSNFFYNDQNRAKQVDWLQREVMNKQQRGVEVYRTK